MRYGSFIVLVGGVTALVGCGPVVAVDGVNDETSDTEFGTDVGTSGGVISSSSVGPDATSGPTTQTPVTSMSTSSPGSTTADETGGEESSSSTTGPEMELCPEEIWPSDGSEVVAFVQESSVAQWNFIGDGSAYFSFMSDDSPVDGQQTRGVSSTEGADSSELFGGTLASTEAEPYLGQRVRMRAQVARNNVEGRATLWLRVDGDESSPNALVGLDNGDDRPVYGSSLDWETDEIVIDVPATADGLVFGSLLLGTGTFLVANPTFEIVSDDVPTTSPNERKPTDALSCLSLSDASAESIVHVFRPDSWAAQSPSARVEIEADGETLYDGVRSLKLSGTIDDEVGGFIPFSSHHPLDRWRIRVPVRSSDFAGAVTLRFSILNSDGVVGYEQPLQLAGDWTHHAVVAEVPVETPEGSAVSLVVNGSGTIHVGYGTIERVGDEVPLSAAFGR